MSASLLVQALVQRLRDAGYDSIPTPFRVASVEFDFTAALRGREGRALDLVLVGCRFPPRLDPGFPLRTDPA